MKFIRGLRAVIHGPDIERARQAEKTAVQAELARGHTFERQMLAAYSGGNKHSAIGVHLATGQQISPPRDRLRGHWSVVGPSGAGKSYFLCLVVKALLSAGVRRFFFADPKDELLSLVERSLVEFANSLPADEGMDLVGRVVRLDPFSKDALPALQILAPEPGLDEEMQAYEVATLITSEINLGGMGIRQESLLHRVVESLIRARLPLTALPRVLDTPEILERLAETSSAPELLKATGARLRGESRERVAGLVARAEALLRLKSMRLSLGAPSSIDFARLLDEKIVLMNLAPPQGSDDIARFLRGLIWTRLAHAIRRRANGSAPSFVAIDEFPTFLNAGGARLADGVEDLLRLARSKGIHLMLLAQDMVSVGKASASLPHVMRNNCHVHAFFRTRDDWGSVLPATGRRPRPPGAPWEEARRGYLSRAEEKDLLREELSRLPDRHLYLWDSRLGLPAMLLKTADLKLSASDEDVRGLVQRASANDCVFPVKDLERHEERTQEHLTAVLRGASSPTAVEEPLRRRGARPLEMG